MSTTCTHCWHYKTGWTDGMAVTGTDSYVCCRCGTPQLREWTAKPDPAHGPFAPDNMVAFYADGRRRDSCIPAMFDERSVALATLREATTWQPMATAPLKAMFWVRPKTADESYHDTSGNPIVSTHAPRLHIGTLKSWSALETAVAWMPLPTPPPEEPR